MSKETVAFKKYPKWVVVGDVHGCADELIELFHTVGCIDKKGDKKEDYHVIQLGDLVDLGRLSTWQDDLRTLQVAYGVVDEYIIGNHELPALFPRLGMGFSGYRDPFHLHPELGSFLKSLPWKPATSAAGWLITHAGLAHRFAKYLPSDVGNLVSQLCDEFEDLVSGTGTEPIPGLFTGIPRVRGGDDKTGGIFWMDDSTYKSTIHLDELSYGQIVGHSYQRWGYWLTGKRWIIDAGIGRCVALVKHGDGDWQPVVVGTRKEL